MLLLALRSLLRSRSRRPTENWPEFRGPHGDGHADAAELPLTWSETEHVRWKTADPRPRLVVAGDLGRPDLAHHRHRGRQADVRRPGRSRFGRPIVRDLLIFAPPSRLLPSLQQLCQLHAGDRRGTRLHPFRFATAPTAIDTATGKTLWTRQDLPCDHFRGPGSSPILWGNLLILTFDGFDFKYVVALDKQTGETVWRTDRNIQYDTDDGDYHKGLRHAHGHRGRPAASNSISPSAGATIAYDPATGHELWRVQSGGMNAAARPLFGHGLVYRHHRLPAAGNCSPSGPTARATSPTATSPGNSAKAFPAAVRRC